MLIKMSILLSAFKSFRFNNVGVWCKLSSGFFTECVKGEDREDNDSIDYNTQDGVTNIVLSQT